MDPAEEKIFDLAIIGGGIAGAGIARDASMRGLSVLLVEKNTFGSGTSSKSSKLIHGGIRYLELAWLAVKRWNFSEARKNFRFVFSSLRETHTLAKIAPHLVKPIGLVIPIYKQAGRSVFTIYAGTLLYAVLAMLTGSKKKPKILANPKAVLKFLPNLNPEGLAGGVLIWDHWTQDQKLVEATLESAVKHGARAMERAEFTGYSFDKDKSVYRLSVVMHGYSHRYAARKIINASGPWVDKIRQMIHERHEDFIVPVAGSHLNFKKFTDHSAILQAEDNRIFFVINMKDISRVGTTERLQTDPDRVEPAKEEIDYLMRALKKYFPASGLSEKDILSRDSGIRPLARPKNDANPNAISREHEVRVSPKGIVHVLGVKLTDHRRAAEEIVDSLMPEMKGFHEGISLKSKTHLEKL